MLSHLHKARNNEESRNMTPPKQNNKFSYWPQTHINTEIDKQIIQNNCSRDTQRATREQK